MNFFHRGFFVDKAKTAYRLCNYVILIILTQVMRGASCMVPFTQTPKIFDLGILTGRKSCTKQHQTCVKVFKMTRLGKKIQECKKQLKLKKITVGDIWNSLKLWPYITPCY